ncbi:hypothetical protein [Thermopirellula anaerolimosa]
MAIHVRSVLASVTACTLLGLIASGCSRGPQKPSDLPDLVPVVAVVKFKGEPVSDAKVLFAPESGKYSAAGVTDAEGRAVMKTEGTYDGVPAGTFKVAVVKVPPPDTTSQPTESAENPEDYERQFRATPTTGAAVVQTALPSRYASFDSSGLSVTVPPASGNEIVLELQQ